MTVREAHDTIVRRLGDPIQGLPNDSFVRDGSRFSAAMRNEWLYEAMLNVVNKTIQKTIDTFAQLSVSPYTKIVLLQNVWKDYFLVWSIQVNVRLSQPQAITSIMLHTNHTTLLQALCKRTLVTAKVRILAIQCTSVLDGNSLADTINVDFSQRIPFTIARSLVS